MKQKIKKRLEIKEKKKNLKIIAETEEIKNFHKQENLEFKSIDISDVRNSQTKIEIYKSPSYNRKQSSQYFIDYINNKLAYIRISNHWGTFTTNVYEGTEDAEKYFKGIKTNDTYGRIGYLPHNWKLSGGKKGNQSQAGYIFI